MKPSAKYFYDNRYRLEISPVRDAVYIFRKNAEDVYELIDTVSEASDNYQAAVKRVHRMQARDKAASSPTIQALSAISGAHTSSRKKSLLTTVREKLSVSNVAGFSMPSNIEGIYRSYVVMRAGVSIKSPVSIPRKTQKPTNTIALYLVTKYNKSKLVLISRFIGKNALADALDFAKTDALFLEPAQIVVMSNGSKVLIDSADNSFTLRQTVYISKAESPTHVLAGLKTAIADFFKTVNRRQKA